MRQKPLFEGVNPKPLPPIEDEPAPTCPMCEGPLDGSRCRKCDPPKDAA